MAYAKTSLRKEKRDLRERMRAKGHDYREIAAELARVYALRPRAAWREAYGLSLVDAAAKFNAYCGETGLDPRGLASMTGAHLSEYENWPGPGVQPTGRKPSAYLLAVLSAVYGCHPADLVDLSDRSRLPAADLLVIDTYARQDMPGGALSPVPARAGSRQVPIADAGRNPNMVLRQIREQERHETREEFAQSMARVAHEAGVPVNPDGKYVERLESGYISYPGPGYRSILAELCGRPFGELGFSTPPGLSLPAALASDDAAGGMAQSASSRMNVPLRDAIVASGLEMSQIARRVGVDVKSVQRWVTRGVIPHPRHRWQTCEILGQDESQLWPVAASAALSGTGTTDTSGTTEDQEEEMERRRLLQSLAVLGFSVSPFSQALETVRTALGGTVAYSDRHHLPYWEETIVEYGYSYLSTYPAGLVPDLAADLLSVRSVMRDISDRDSVEYRSWCRVGGALSALLAKSLSSLGHSRHSREWWNMAQYLADACGDPNFGLWVRGEHIIHGLYENRPVPVLLRQVNSAMALAENRPCVGLVEVSGAGAQVAALAGDYRSAEESLNRTEDLLSKIGPSSAISDIGLVMGWGEAEFRYTEAWVYSHMGENAETDRAAEDALSLYPASDKRSPAQIKLMQAFTRVRSGDITEGIRRAQTAYEPLDYFRTKMVDALAQQVLSAIPAASRRQPDVDGYRMLLSSRIPDGRMIEA